MLDGRPVNMWLCHKKLRIDDGSSTLYDGENNDGRPVNLYHHVCKRGECEKDEEDEFVDYTMYMVSILFNRRSILCISYYLLKFDQRK